jgi:hypothetical protein
MPQLSRIIIIIIIISLLYAYDSELNRAASGKY